MSRWRIVLVAAFLAIPFVVLAGLGSYFLMTLPWGFLYWWGVVAVMALGYGLAVYWQSKRQLLKPVDFTPPIHWTERDQKAWKLVEARAHAAPKVEVARLTDPQHFLAVGQEMAQELAAFYHPGARDPVGKLTLPEMLAVVELAAHDLAEMVDQYVPAGHLLTIDNFRQAKVAAGWFNTASNVMWAVSAIFNPINTGLRFAANKIGVTTPLQMLQNNLIVWFYTAYLHRIGTYLIDLNSGRLRVGATRYRELLKSRQMPAAPDGAAPPDEADVIGQVTVTLLGQVKAGKSSLANALLGEQRARTDVLPVHDEVQRYELKTEGIPTKLTLLDTMGYNNAGPRADQLRATQEAARHSDLLLLVLHATNPARQADLDLLKALKAHFESQPQLKHPPVLAVVTHIDLLKPSLEWKPPYHWEKPQRPKEENIHQALAAVREQLGDYVAGVVPVCAASGKVYGVQEWVLPAVAARLDSAHAVALLRCLTAEADTGKVRKVFGQLLAAGKETAKIVWKSLVR
jgi:predicted GTPase